MVKFQKCGAPRFAGREQRLEQFFSYRVAPGAGGTVRTSTPKLKKLKKKGMTKAKNIKYFLQNS